ncbi:MAG TPA: vWA domain-containing protein, partial [Ktedonobacterales bacterium]|nr:vWA domain-containing protein [Ktedonobacterales bacterium]
SSSHVTILVLDMSGSMSDSDPNGLRCSAANAYIDLSGIGDYIGVVDLDGSTSSPDTATVLQTPVEMATVAARQGLRHEIALKTNNCAPDSATPTYDALNKALTMLHSATHNGQISGSVILLTDGEPDPNTDQQISTIESKLVPQFKQHNWPIDTIALGSDQSFRGFLSDLANATSGKAYDDAKGVVPGVSPLNIADFFVDIFARRNGRTLGPTVPPTTLNGGRTSRNFQLGSYVTHLDVIVVKDQPNTTVTLIAPNGQQITQNISGAFLSTDPHYAIFSIDGPQSGYWQVNVNGSGRFLVDSLVVSPLAITIVSPSVNSPVLPLGQPFTVGATIINNGTPVSGNAFTVQGTISYAGGVSTTGTPFTEQLQLSDSASPGAYEAQVTVPNNATPGAYEITVTASQVTSQPIGSASVTVRIEKFPAPYLLSNGHPTTGTVTDTVTRWDPGLQIIYGAPIGFLQWLGEWPLGGRPANVDADINGLIELNGQPYGSATVVGTATLNGSNTSVPITVVNDGGGQFHVLFSAPQDGVYTIHFHTAGSFKDSHGDFGLVDRTAQLSVVGASLTEEIIAWVITLLYVAIVGFIVILVRFALLPAPGGRYQTTTGAHEATGQPPMPRALKTGRGLFAMLGRRNLLTSKVAFGKEGAEMLFGYGGGVEARAIGPNASRWFDDTGRPLGERFRHVKGLTFSPAGNPQDDPRAETYTFLGKGRGVRRTAAGTRENSAAQADTRRVDRSRDKRRAPARGNARGGANRGGRTYNDVI